MSNGNIIVPNSPKIDDVRTNGLDGVFNSLAYRVGEIQRHMHSYESFFGAAAVPNGEIHVADHLTLTPFQMDAGNATFGNWLQVLGSSDTPHFTGCEGFDISRFQIIDVENDATPSLIQFGYGTSGADALANDDVTEIIVTPVKNSKQDPYTIKTKRKFSGTKAWIRCWVNGKDTSTIDFFIGLHEYEG